MSIKHFKQRFLSFLRYLNAVAGGAFLAILLGVAINGSVLTFYRVDGHSMESTLHNGQLLAVNLLAFTFSKPAIGNVVIVRYAGDPSVRFVKRIEGTPGMVVQYQGQNLTLGPNQYFVLGDNRDASTDSRVYGPITRSNILGEVIGVPPFNG